MLSPDTGPSHHDFREGTGGSGLGFNIKLGLGLGLGLYYYFRVRVRVRVSFQIHHHLPNLYHAASYMPAAALATSAYSGYMGRTVGWMLGCIALVGGSVRVGKPDNTKDLRFPLMKRPFPAILGHFKL